MPIIKSAIKRAKQTVARRAKNVEIKKAVHGAEKAFAAKPSAAALRKVQSEYDKAQKKGLMKKNTISRRKAAVYAKAKSVGVKLSASAKPKAAPKTSASAKTAIKPAAKPAAKATVKAKPTAKPATKKPAAKSK